MALRDVCVFSLNYLSALVEDIPEDRLYEGQLDHVNAPGWVLGHISVETDDGLRYAGGDQVVPQSWYDHFYYTAPRISSLDGLPQKEEMLSACKKAVIGLMDVVEVMPDELLDKPCHSEFLREHLPTERDWYVHILTTHIAIHAGNVATWRKLHGLAAAGY